MVDLSVLIPVFNEEKSLPSLIKELKEVLPETGLAYEIIAIDDGSSDNSYDIASKQGITVIKNPYNLGYGASLKRGILRSSGKYILTIDADGTYPVKPIKDMIKYMKDYEMVVGSRTGKNVSIPLMRKPAKKILSIFANFLTGRKIPDLNSGLRIFTRQAADRFFHLFPSRFSFSTTITLACLANDLRLLFHKIDYYKRKGRSTIHPIKDFVGFMGLIARIMAYFKPFKMFGLLSLILFVAAIAIYLYSFIILNRVMDITVIVVALSAMQVFLFGVLAELVVKRKQ